jgi:hypothetical protein
MADDPTKVVALHGVGLISGTLPDGRSCRHYGGVFRSKGPAENPEAAKAFVEGAMAGVEALRNRGDCEPAGPLEMMGCWDAETHEIVHMWRMACVEIVTH